MGTTAEQMAAQYPIPTYRFHVSVGDEVIAFSSVTGLESTNQTIEYKDGVDGLYQMPGQRDAINITLNKGIYFGQGPFYDWISSISLDRVEKKDITISLMSESGSEPLVSWNIIDAFPIKLSAPGLDATSNETAIEELSLLATRLTVAYR